MVDVPVVLLSTLWSSDGGAHALVVAMVVLIGLEFCFSLGSG